MPELPTYLDLTTQLQLKAFAEPVRVRILRIIQNQPATAKQIADRLGLSPGTIGYHLQVLEDAGLAQIVARRLIRGIVAKYYTRTARVFNFNFPQEMVGEAAETALDSLASAHEEWREVRESYGDEACLSGGLPHARLSQERAQYYAEQLDALVEEFVKERHDPTGQVFSLSVALFKSPPYVQGNIVTAVPAAREEAPAKRRRGRRPAHNLTPIK
jgi:DNA-binding transcriptional ArsR family regulator